MKYLKLYENFVEKIDKMNQDVHMIGVKKKELVEKMFKDVCNLFVNKTTSDNKIERDAKLEINSERITHLFVNNNGIIKVNLRSGSFYDLYSLGDENAGDWNIKLLAELYDKCIELYPEWFEGDAMGFFNVKEEMRDRFASIKIIEHFFNIAKDEQDSIWFEPNIKTEVGEISSLWYDGSRYYISYKNNNSYSQTYDIYGRSDNFLDVVAKALEENYPEAFEGEAMGFFNTKGENS